MPAMMAPVTTLATINAEAIKANAPRARRNGTMTASVIAALRLSWR